MTPEQLVDATVTFLRDGVLVVLAGGVGGIISTWLTNKAAARRQTAQLTHATDIAGQRLQADRELADQRLQADRELADQRAQAEQALADQRAHAEQALADQRTHADTIAAVRADRGNLYIEIHHAIQPFADYYYDAFNPFHDPSADGWTNLRTTSLHNRATAALETYDELRPRVTILAPQTVRDSYADLRPSLIRWQNATGTLARNAKNHTEDLWSTYVHTVMVIGPDYTSTQRALESHMRADVIHPALDDNDPTDTNHDLRDDAAPEGGCPV